MRTEIVFMAVVQTSDGIKRICVGNGPLDYLAVWYKDKQCPILQIQPVQLSYGRM